MKNTNSLLVVVAIAAAAAAVALPAQAQVSISAPYLGGSLGQSDGKKFNHRCEGFANCDKTGSAWKLFGGLQLTRNLGFEAGYTDLGKFSATSAGTSNLDLKVKAWDASALLVFPFAERFAAFGRLGGYYAKSDQSLNLGGVISNATENNGGFTFGLGVELYPARNIGVRGEWQRYAKVGGGSIGGDIDIDVLSVGLVVKFR